MREIGGYIELDKYNLPMLHENAIALNCGRNALGYLIRAKNIKKILLPKFLCDSVVNLCKREKVEVKYYSISNDFLPKDIVVSDDEWLYIVNYYGQISNEKISEYATKYKNIIVDNAQAYFQEHLENIDTLYTCRKFFGVPDGAFLYTNKEIEENLIQDESFERMRFLLGRFERTASEFYEEYKNNNNIFTNEQIKYMSKLTKNLLHAIDYDFIRSHRTQNFIILHEALKNKNNLEISVAKGAFMYPFYIENGSEIRKLLQNKKIYIPVLWPEILETCHNSELEYDMAKNILSLPVDQRYTEEDMKYIIEEVLKCIS